MPRNSPRRQLIPYSIISNLTNQLGLKSKTIELRGVRVHNLQNIDLDLPLQRLIVLTGVSGSGKSSLAFDTLAAEGQRRYIESFSTYARRFLDRLERPDADRIDQIPPAIAIRQKAGSQSRRSTVATATEIYDSLRLLYAKLGRIVCPECRLEVRCDSPASVQTALGRLAPGTRLMVCFALPPETSLAEAVSSLVEEGFRRVIVQGTTRDVQELASEAAGAANAGESPFLVVVDRLTAGSSSPERLADTLELAFDRGHGGCIVLAENRVVRDPVAHPENGSLPQPSELLQVDDRSWQVLRFDRRLLCPACAREFLSPEPRLFSFNSPLGACPQCRGFGSVPAISFAKVVPDPSKTLRDGAIAPWTTPAYRHELDELLALATDYKIPVDVPFRELETRHLDLIRKGVPERNFGGLQGFFAWLEKRRYKLSVSVFLSRWRDFETCAACAGKRLQPLALAVQVAGRNIAELCGNTVQDAVSIFDRLTASLQTTEAALAAPVLPQIVARLRYLGDVGLEYLSLDRPLTTLSGGETQRVMLTAALGSNLVNTLYVLDEPSVGLHPRDTERLLTAILRLRDAGNTVAVVEHETAIMRRADRIVDIGPGAGKEGGRVVFEGTPAELAEFPESVTGPFLRGTASGAARQSRRQPTTWLELKGVQHHNLQGVDARFPLGVLCVVTGVSGSGKSSLVEETLYPALCQAFHQPSPAGLAGRYTSLSGTGLNDTELNDTGQIGGALLVDQTPIGKTPRSNPATYLKIFDTMRRLFAETAEAKVRDLSAGHFSFNTSTGGRCPSCQGNGSLAIDMQFLPDVTMVCPDCQGTRYRRDILEVKYRGLSIAEVLAMTAREAFPFFRGESQLQRRLKLLKEVGLDYVTLGQPADTLSGGESQRLKLAACLSQSSRTRTLFILDEPTTGLHPADVRVLLDCFNVLLSAGHSLLVVEHNLDVMCAADYLIDLGPEAGAAGGQIVAEGTPEQVAATNGSLTGAYLGVSLRAV